MIAIAPMTNRASIRTGTHGGLSLALCGIGGVYRDDGLTAPDAAVRAALVGVATRSPGLVPAGVVRPPPVLRFGGAITPERKGLRARRAQHVPHVGDSRGRRCTDRRYRPAGDPGAR